ncbi:MAG: hypothetical protein Q9163_005494, partial [Psora crenata]
MPTELEELVEFLRHGNTQIRHIGTTAILRVTEVENLMQLLSHGKPRPLFEIPARDLQDQAAHSTKNALTILVNISGDPDVLKELAEDDVFLETVLSRVTDPKEATANTLSMLLANLTKSPPLERLIKLERTAIPALLPAESKLAIAQLIEIYNLGSGWNKDADYDYLGYVFADLAK